MLGHPDTSFTATDNMGNFPWTQIALPLAALGVAGRRVDLATAEAVTYVPLQARLTSVAF